LNLRSRGYVISVGDGIVTVLGLEDVLSSELVILNGSMFGLAMNLQRVQVGIILFGNDRQIGVGDTVEKTNQIISMPIGSNEYLGRIVDSLGNFIDGLGTPKFPSRALIDKKAPGIVDRESVRQSLFTGVKAVDSMIPIGKGQRELIIGDRQTGKSAIAIDTILNQKLLHVKNSPEKVFLYLCCYWSKKINSCSIGSKFKKRGCFFLYYYCCCNSI